MSANGISIDYFAGSLAGAMAAGFFILRAASSAILDRLLHHSYLLRPDCKIYRLKEATKWLFQRTKIKDEKEKD